MCPRCSLQAGLLSDTVLEGEQTAPGVLPGPPGPSQTGRCPRGKAPRSQKPQAVRALPAISVRARSWQILAGGDLYFYADETLTSAWCIRVLRKAKDLQTCAASIMCWFRLESALWFLNMKSACVAPPAARPPPRPRPLRLVVLILLLLLF